MRVNEISRKPIRPKVWNVIVIIITNYSWRLVKSQAIGHYNDMTQLCKHANQ